DLQDPKTLENLCLSPDGQSLLARRGPKLELWRLDTREHVILEGHRILVNQHRFYPDSRRVVSNGEDGQVILRDVIDGRTLLSFNTGLGPCFRVNPSADEKRLVLPLWAGFIQLWDVDTNRQLALLRACDVRQLACAATFLDEDTLASVFDDEVRIWHAPSRDE